MKKRVFRCFYIVLFCANRKGRKESQTFRLIDVRMVFFVQSAPRQVFLRVRKSHRGTTADGKKKWIFYGGITSIVNCNFVPKASII